MADTVALMAFDQHWGTGDPGPVAGQDWFEQTLALDMKQLDPSRTIVIFASLRLRWALKDANGSGSAHR